MLQGIEKFNNNNIKDSNILKDKNEHNNNQAKISENIIDLRNNKMNTTRKLLVHKKNKNMSKYSKMKKWIF